MELPFDDRAKRWYAAGFCVAVAIAAWVFDGFVPILGHVDFGIHELGHLLTFALPDSAMLLAGSVFQVAVPAALSIYFWKWNRDRVGAAVTLAWAGSSLINVGVYVGDGQEQQLPIIGARHDWATLLGRWDLLDMAPNLGGLIGAIGFIAIGVAAVAVILPARKPAAAARHVAVRPS